MPDLNPPTEDRCPACGHFGQVEDRDDRTLYWHDDDLFPCSVRYDRETGDDEVLVHLRAVADAIEREDRHKDIAAPHTVEAFRRFAVGIVYEAMLLRACDIDVPPAERPPGPPVLTVVRGGRDHQLRGRAAR
jgi:hypothetical protein